MRGNPNWGTVPRGCRKLTLTGSPVSNAVLFLQPAPWQAVFTDGNSQDRELEEPAKARRFVFQKEIAPGYWGWRCSVIAKANFPVNACQASGRKDTMPLVSPQPTGKPLPQVGFCFKPTGVSSLLSPVYLFFSLISHCLV